MGWQAVNKVQREHDLYAGGEPIAHAEGDLKLDGDEVMVTSCRLKVAGWGLGAGCGVRLSWQSEHLKKRT